ncbi:Hint domain-containing protein [Roseovarius sp. D0-M9]|uniref:Hint domain-containing protein n=1 Tax=Roseovarius sp. D0-M9 TaxID=3127117 RepID=UPI0030104957
MPTTFDVIFLGNLPLIDTEAGNDTSENAAGILGTYGAPSDPLSEQVQTLSAENLSVRQPGMYDTNNWFFADSFRIDGAAPQYFDAVALYDAVITYADGDTADITAIVFQDVDGKTYLAPHLTENPDRAALTAKPILSLSLQSVLEDTANMEGNRVAGDFKTVVDGTSGDDDISIYSGYVDAQGDAVTTGADYILGGDGNDTINADSGNDTIYGGAGGDLIDDWIGDDLVFAGESADMVDLSSGNDTVFMEGGDDLVRLWDNAGDNSLDGGAGNDTLDFHNWQSTDGAQVDIGPDGAGTFSHYSGNTTGTFTSFEHISGTAFNDMLDATDATIGITLSGEGGNDSLVGGNGDDTLAGGTGDDTLTGGTGDDVFVYSGGSDFITDFNKDNSGTLNDGDNSNNDRIDLSGYYDHLFELWADQADDGVLNQSNVFDTQGNAVVYSDNTQFAPNEGITFLSASADSSFFTVENTGVICFATGTLILTERGEVPIERLAPGERVITRDNGPQAIVWTGSRHVPEREMARNPKLKPVCIAPELIGADTPLVVSPQHGLLFRASGGDETLVRATHLARLRGGKARVMRGCQRITYHHMMFEAHQIIFANGAPAESFYPGPQALGALAPDTRAEISVLFPELLCGGPSEVYGQTARGFAAFRQLPDHLGALARAQG